MNENNQYYLCEKCDDLVWMGGWGRMTALFGPRVDIFRGKGVFLNGKCYFCGKPNERLKAYNLFNYPMPLIAYEK